MRRLLILLTLLLASGCATTSPGLLTPKATPAPALVSPTVAPASGYARLGDVVGLITADGTTTAVRITNIQPDHVVAIQVWGTWDGAVVTVQMRICATAPVGGSACPFIVAPNVAVITSDALGLNGHNFQVYGPETEIRVSVASAGAGTSLLYTVRQ